MSDRSIAENQIEVPGSADADLPQSRLSVPDSVDSERFFSDADGEPTLVDHADLEKTIPNNEKEHLRELERTWLYKPFSFGIIYENEREQNLRYYVVEPFLSEKEKDLVEFFKEKLEFSIDISALPTEASMSKQAEIIREETLELMDRYDLIQRDVGQEGNGLEDRFKEGVINLLRRRAQKQALKDKKVDPVPVDRDPETGERKKLGDSQIEKIVYYLIRDFVRFGKIDPFKQDPNIEDISCNGYNKHVFVVHTEHGSMYTNIKFGEEELDNFVIELAQSAGKGISKRNPDIDATLADGSRAQLTLGTEISAKGTNFTIRQFKEVPFTPVDLISWQTYSIEEIVYLWLAIENNKSLIVSGGTASGKTTTLNALSLFIDARSKIVSLEDTRELIIPQKNWVADTTRESFRKDDGSTIGMYQLLRDALRKRPDYILVGEVRGEEARTLFQAMNTGHTVMTTFHAEDPTEVITRFIEEPINVSRTMVGSIDIVLSQRSTQTGGRTVRRCTEILEMSRYNVDTEKYDVDKTFSWDSTEDRHIHKIGGQSDLMQEVRAERGWTDAEFEREWERRKIVLSYLIDNGLNSYAAVAAVVQAYMSSPGTIMELIANDELAKRVDNLKSMKTISVQIDPNKEALVPRPTPGPEVQQEVESILEDGSLLADYRTDKSDYAQSMDEYISDPQVQESPPPWEVDEQDPSEHPEIPGEPEEPAPDSEPTPQADTGEPWTPDQDQAQPGLDSETPDSPPEPPWADWADGETVESVEESANGNRTDPADQESPLAGMFGNDTSDPEDMDEESDDDTTAESSSTSSEGHKDESGEADEDTPELAEPESESESEPESEPEPVDSEPADSGTTQEEDGDSHPEIVPDAVEDNVQQAKIRAYQLAQDMTYESEAGFHPNRVETEPPEGNLEQSGPEEHEESGNVDVGDTEDHSESGAPATGETADRGQRSDTVSPEDEVSVMGQQPVQDRVSTNGDSPQDSIPDSENQGEDREEVGDTSRSLPRAAEDLQTETNGHGKEGTAEGDYGFSQTDSSTDTPSVPNNGDSPPDPEAESSDADTDPDVDGVATKSEKSDPQQSDSQEDQGEDEGMGDAANGGEKTKESNSAGFIGRIKALFARGGDGTEKATSSSGAGNSTDTDEDDSSVAAQAQESDGKTGTKTATDGETDSDIKVRSVDQEHDAGAGEQEGESPDDGSTGNSTEDFDVDFDLGVDIDTDDESQESVSNRGDG